MKTATEIVTDNSPLTVEQAARLMELEGIVEKNKDAYIAVGKALGEICEKRLYRESHPNFNNYMKDILGIGRFSGYDYINAAKVAENLKTVESTQHMSFTQAVLIARRVKDADKQKTLAGQVNFLETTVKELMGTITAIKGSTPRKATPAVKVGKVVSIVNKASKAATEQPGNMTAKQREKLKAALRGAVELYTKLLESLETASVEDEQLKTA